MSTTYTPIAELERMSLKELRRELLLKRADLVKARLNIEMQIEKNHAKHKREKKEIARMAMVLKNMERHPESQPQKKAVAPPVVAENSTKTPSQRAKKTVKDSGSKRKKV
jgi:hypothetical protein